MIWNLKNLIEHSKEIHTDTKEAGWVPARPINLRSIKRWFYELWLVATGKADVVVWPGNQ